MNGGSRGMGPGKKQPGRLLSRDRSEWSGEVEGVQTSADVIPVHCNLNQT